MEKAVQVLEQQLAVGRTELDREREVSLEQITALREHLTALQGELATVREHARARTDQLEAELRELRTRLEVERTRADRAEGIAEGMRVAREEASGPQAHGAETGHAKPAGGLAAWLRSVREAFRS